MSTLVTEGLEHFLHGQIDCWNSGDREGFFALYRNIAPKGLSLEYVGLPQGDAWAMLEQMWDKSQANIRIEVLCSIISGNEAACHHRNNRLSGENGTETIELYKIDDGHLTARYFIRS